jgi:transcriptional regulator with XRE-family HTH domain
MDNKNVFAENLNYYMREYGKSRRDVSEALGVSYYTFTDWVKGKKYPRMDKVEMLAKYFGILKSDLIEKRTEEHREMQKKNDVLSDIVLKLNEDMELLSIVETLSKLDFEKREAVKVVLSALATTDK